MRFSLRQFLKYSVTGAIAAGVEYGAFFVLYKLAGLWFIWANSIGMGSGFFMSFFLNRNWTFRSDGNIYRQLGLYGLIFAINLSVSNVLILLLSGRLQIAPPISKMLIMCLIVSWNFVIYRSVIYKYRA